MPVTLECKGWHEYIICYAFCMTVILYRREVLNKWKQKLSHNATYKALIEAFVKADRLDCADTVCRCTLMESPSVKAKCKHVIIIIACIVYEYVYIIIL